MPNQALLKEVMRIEADDIQLQETCFFDSIL